MNNENFDIAPNDENEEFTVEFGEIFNDGGTHDYNELDNKPKINGNTVEGNKTTSELGIPVYSAGENITISDDYVISATGGGGGTSDYEDLDNLPKVNNVTLTGNKSLSDLGIQPAGDYALESEIPDVSNFITKSVDDLVNYYKKSETFTKQEVNNLISAITTLDIRVVQTLPTEDISTTTIYLVPKTTAEANNAYDEYIYVSNAWEHIGSTEVDLTDYVKNTDYATNSTGGVFKVSSTYGLAMSQAGILYGSGRTYAQYQSAGTNLIVAKGTLENVITGKGLVSNTDYPDNGASGVIKVGASYGTGVSSTGHLIGSIRTYANYSTAGDYMLISKGTLENALTGKGLNPIVELTQSEYDALTTKDSNTYYYIVEE